MKNCAKRFIITIDGPVASGKSTIARMLADQLGYYYIYSGILYRALAYAARENNIDIENITEQQVHTLLNMLTYQYSTKEHICFHDKDITDQLFTPAVDDAASRISVLPHVRDVINDWQKKLAQSHDAIVDGRDSGSVVFKDADLKLYLDAPIVIRAERWLHKQRKQGWTFTMQEAVDVIKQRDERDAQRSVSPLIVPDGAVILENVQDPEDIIEQIVKLISQVNKEIND